MSPTTANLKAEKAELQAAIVRLQHANGLLRTKLEDLGAAVHTAIATSQPSLSMRQLEIAVNKAGY